MTKKMIDKIDNVLLLNMSKMYSVYRNFYCDFCEDNKAYIFDGISQLEAGTKSVISRLANQGVVLDRIIVTCSPQSFELIDEVGDSSFDYYKKRIGMFLSKQDIDGEKEMFNGNDLLDELHHSKNTDKHDLVDRLDNSTILNDECFKEKIGNIYKTFDLNNVIPIKMEGIGTEDASTISFLKDTILGDADFVNVFLDIQGGDRSFTYVLNTILSLFNENEVDVIRAVSTDFYSKNIVNEIQDKIDSFKLVKLITAIKAFTNYGRGDLLVKYFEEKGYDKDSDTNRFVNDIKGISDALQISDPAGLTNAIEDLSNMISKNRQYEDPFLNLVASDIVNDYGDVLKHVDPKHNDFGLVVRYLDIIDWCIRKGFIQQGLTFIEDKMPAFFMNKKVIDLEYITGIDVNNKSRVSDDEITSLRKAAAAPGYESDIDRIIFYNIFSKIVEPSIDEYMDLLYRQIASDIANKVIPEPWFEYIENDEKRQDTLLTNFLVKRKEQCGNVYEFCNIDIVDFIKKMHDDVVSSTDELGKNADKIYSVFIGQKVNRNSPATAEAIKAAITKRFKLEDGKEISYWEISQHTKSLEIINAVKNWFADDSSLSKEVRKYLNYRGIINLIYARYPEKLETVYGELKISKVYELIKKNSGPNANNYIKIWLEDKPNIYNNYKNILRDYEISDRRIRELYENLNKSLEKGEINEPLIENYILYRNVQKGLESNSNKVPYFIMIKLMESLKPLFDPSENKFSLSRKKHNYVTWVGLIPNKKYTFKYSKEKGKKGTRITVKGHLNNYLYENASEIDLILRLHEALKQERNNSNHASEKGLRLNADIVRYMMDAYVKMCKKYILEPLQKQESQDADTNNA